jgi:uncharacterized protein (DUF1697 family)
MSKEMKTYVSILRGINVSGKNSIKMDALKRLFENLNFQNVTTYVQSGNVVFSFKPTDVRALEKLISSEIDKHFGFKVPVIVLTTDELKEYIGNNPFTSSKDEKFLHFTFLAARPSDFIKENIDNVKAENEEIEISGRVVYLYCPNGYGKTKLSNTFLEKTLKVTSTTRNFKTTIALLKIAEQIQ